jgi:hypothetical protein
LGGFPVSVPVIQALTLGLLRLAAMGAAIWLYISSHGDGLLVTVAAGLLAFAVTGQAFDVFSVARQVASASTTTTVTLQQPADAPTPVQLTAKTEPAPQPKDQP